MAKQLKPGDERHQVGFWFRDLDVRSQFLGRPGRQSQVVLPRQIDDGFDPNIAIQMPM
jgi:hypothetical protein